MRYSLIALAATTLLSSASARGHVHRRHAHSNSELPSAVVDECVCSTYITSYLVEYTREYFFKPVFRVIACDEN